MWELFRNSPVSLKPGRRIPKSFQRRPSRQTRKYVRSMFKGKTAKERLRSLLSRTSRRAGRLQRMTAIGVSHLRVWLICTLVASLIALLGLFLFSSAFAVQSIHVSRQDVRIDIEEVQQTLSSFFGKHLFTLTTAHVERIILAAFPEISGVSVRKNYPSEIEVVLFTDAFAADVFIGLPDDTEDHLIIPETPGQYAYLTSRGHYVEYIFLVPKRDPETQRMIVHLVDWATKPVHRQRILSEESLQEMQLAQTLLQESFGHSVQWITLYLRANEFHVKTDSVTLWFDFATPVVQQIDRYRHFLQNIPLTDVQRYIDLRLYNRIVYL
jgi:hypothetical protein